MNDECQFLIIVESGKYYLYPYYIPKKESVLLSFS